MQELLSNDIALFRIVVFHGEGKGLISAGIILDEHLHVTVDFLIPGRHLTAGVRRNVQNENVVAQGGNFIKRIAIKTEVGVVHVFQVTAEGAVEAIVQIAALQNIRPYAGMVSPNLSCPGGELQIALDKLSTELVKALEKRIS